jgi:hypothetical protein
MIKYKDISQDKKLYDLQRQKRQNSRIASC